MEAVLIDVIAAMLRCSDALARALVVAEALRGALGNNEQPGLVHAVPVGGLRFLTRANDLTGHGRRVVQEVTPLGTCGSHNEHGGAMGGLPLVCEPVGPAGGCLGPALGAVGPDDAGGAVVSAPAMPSPLIGRLLYHFPTLVRGRTWVAGSPGDLRQAFAGWVSVARPKRRMAGTFRRARRHAAWSSGAEHGSGDGCADTGTERCP
ncbi:hypothetical protein [Streptomyces sp. NPDC056291]|uniref:hypothetical protein n=1 Tax=Streptomyces sp. NPDC056291 TaxID=3345772 RepID=UPI0035DB3EA8